MASSQPNPGQSQRPHFSAAAGTYRAFTRYRARLLWRCKLLTVVATVATVAFCVCLAVFHFLPPWPGVGP